MAAGGHQLTPPPNDSSRTLTTVGSLVLVLLGSLLLPVVGLLWAAARTNYWGEGREYAVLATTFYVLAFVPMVLGVVGLRSVGRGKWAAYVIVPGVVLAIGGFVLWVGSE